MAPATPKRSPGRVDAWRSANTHVLSVDMPSVQVKDVPDDVHTALRRQAAQRGQSLQEYLLAALTDLAFTPTLDEVLTAARGRAGGSLPLAAAAIAVRAGRGRP
jgi:plasmid stability protein